MDKDAQFLTGTLTLDQKIGQMIMAAIPGTSMNKKGEAIFEKYLPGGIILFGYNISEKEKLGDYIDEMQKKSMAHSGIPLFISIDQEGGRVKRVVKGVTQFPGNMASGSAGDGALVYKMARILGMELRMMGINMNLAPVLDVNNNPDNPVINIRSFGSDTALVSEMGKSYIRGLQDARCIAVGKHFPGHGDTNKDSHLTLPVIKYGEERLNRIEFPPFIEAIKENVDGIMTAHIAYPEILKNNEPATMSKEFLTVILRERMKFSGIIFTDDMEMKAVSGDKDIGEAAVKSILAGADVILFTSYGSSVNVIVDSIKKAVADGRISAARIDESVKRILEVKLRYKIMALRDKKIEPGRVSYSSEEVKILNESSSVNEELSRKAIFYRGDARLLAPGKEAARIFITVNRDLKKYLSLDDNDRIIAGERELNLGAGRGGAGKIVYFHIEDLKPNIQRLKYLNKICKQAGADLVVISSGNPFPLMASGDAGSIIISFSDTEESMKQLAYCLNGRFAPTMTGKSFLGLNREP